MGDQDRLYPAWLYRICINCACYKLCLYKLKLQLHPNFDFPTYRGTSTDQIPLRGEASCSMSRYWFSGLTAGIAGIAIATPLLWAASFSPARAAALTIVTPGVDGAFVPLVPRDPGEYGFEGRGGSPTTWELGLGTHTSVPGSFNEATFPWAGLQPFEINWVPGSLVSVQIGSTSLSYSADWLVGNAIRILAKREALLTLSEVDGESLVSSVGAVDGTSLESLFITGDSLLDGWSLKGQIQIAPGGNSRNEVLITGGQFTPNAAVPEPLSVVALLLVAGVGLGLKQRTDPA